MADETRKAHPARDSRRDADSLTSDGGSSGGADASANADTAPAAADETTPLSEIGAALRRLRMQRGLRQYEAAEAAGVTKAMLSAYETGKRRPSLKSLDSLLTAMQAHLGDLHRALMAERRQNDYLTGGESVSGRGGHHRRRGPHVLAETVPAATSYANGYGDLDLAAAADIYDLLGIHGPLPAEEERALSEMLRGFLKLLRFLHHTSAEAGGNARRSRAPFDGG